MHHLTFISNIRRLLIFIALFSTLSFDLTQSSISLEHQVKAVYLFNFAQFIEWPEKTFKATDDPIILGILGKNPFGSFLEEIVKGEAINGRPIIIQHYATVKEIKSCHILFIHPSVNTRMDNILNDLKGRNILTVSDAANFNKLGGMIRFVKEANKIKLQVKLDAVKETDIAISSKLLRLSEIVE